MGEQEAAKKRAEEFENQRMQKWATWKQGTLVRALDAPEVNNAKIGVQSDYQAYAAAIKATGALKMREKSTAMRAQKVAARKEQGEIMANIKESVLQIQRRYRHKKLQEWILQKQAAKQAVIDTCLWMQAHYRGHKQRVAFQQMIPLILWRRRDKKARWMQRRYLGYEARTFAEKWRKEKARAILWLQTRYRGCAAQRRGTVMLAELFKGCMQQFSGISSNHVKIDLYTKVRKVHYDERLKSYYEKRLLRHRELLQEMRKPKPRSPERDAAMKESQNAQWEIKKYRIRNRWAKQRGLPSANYKRMIGQSRATTTERASTAAAAEQQERHDEKQPSQQDLKAILEKAFFW